MEQHLQEEDLADTCPSSLPAVGVVSFEFEGKLNEGNACDSNNRGDKTVTSGGVHTFEVDSSSSDDETKAEDEDKGAGRRSVFSDKQEVVLSELLDDERLAQLEAECFDEMFNVFARQIEKQGFKSNKVEKSEDEPMNNRESSESSTGDDSDEFCSYYNEINVRSERLKAPSIWVTDSDDKREVEDGAARIFKEDEVLAEGRPSEAPETRGEVSSKEQSVNATYFRSVPGCKGEMSRGDERDEGKSDTEDLDGDGNEFSGEDFQGGREMYAELSFDVPAEGGDVYLEMNKGPDPENEWNHTNPDEVSDDHEEPEEPTRTDPIRTRGAAEDVMDQPSSSTPQQGSLDDIFFFNDGLGKSEEEDDEDERKWEQEQGRIQAFYKFYDDSDEDCERPGRMIKVQFSPEPLSQVIHYETDSSDSDSLRSSSEDSQSLAKTSDVDSDESILEALSPTNSQAKTNLGRKSECPHILRTVLRTGVLVSVGLLFVWFAIKHLKMLQPFRFN